MTETLEDKSALELRQLGLKQSREAGGGWALIDWVWQLLISYQLHLWGKALRFRHGLFNESVLWFYCRGLALNQRGAENPYKSVVAVVVYWVYDICAPFEQVAFTLLKEATAKTGIAGWKLSLKLSSVWMFEKSSFSFKSSICQSFYYLRTSFYT